MASHLFLSSLLATASDLLKTAANVLKFENKVCLQLQKLRSVNQQSTNLIIFGQKFMKESAEVGPRYWAANTIHERTLIWEIVGALVLHGK